MPLQKSVSGDFIGILSSTSLDRDDEFMTKELLEDWASSDRVLPMLANHENKIEKLIGGWTDKKLVSNGDNHALMAKPFFLKSNPLGRQTEEMVNEALDKGLEVGISIGAIPSSDGIVEKEINGKTHRGYSKAEIVEATCVPIQSSRESSFQRIAKQFNLEEIKMTEDVKKDSPEEESKEEAVVVEAPVEEPKEEVKEEVKSDGQAEVEAAKKLILELTKKFEALDKKFDELTNKAVINNAPVVEEPVVEKAVEDNSPITVEKMCEMRLGGK